MKGQNGFRLSLFGADPAGDHDRILREFGGRRLNLTDAGASLLLRKATGQAEHGGGVRLRADSIEYELLRKWIAAGAKADDRRVGAGEGTEGVAGRAGGEEGRGVPPEGRSGVRGRHDART